MELDPTVMTAVISALGTIGVTWLTINSQSVKNRLRKVETTSVALDNDIMAVKKVIHRLDSNLEDHNKVIQNIISSRNIYEEIDDIVKHSYEYISHDRFLMAYIEHKSKATKEFVKDIIYSDFKLTCNEIKAKFENYINIVKQLDNDLPSNVVGLLKINRAFIEKVYLNEVIKIVTDNITNSKYNRFKNATVYFVDKEIVTFVKTFIKNK